MWGYQIEVVWHRISEPGEAWKEWRDARGRPIESEAGRKLVLEADGPAGEDTSGGGANLWDFDEDAVSCEDPLKIGGFIPDPTPDAETLQSSDEEDDSQATKIVGTAFHPPATAATKRRKTSSKANPFITKRRRPRKTARPPATFKAPKGPIKRSISALTELITRKLPAPAGPPNAGGASVKKRQRQREAVREEDEAALDKIVGMLAAAIANNDHLMPTRSLGRLCEELDRKVRGAASPSEAQTDGRTRTPRVSSGSLFIARTSCSSLTGFRDWQDGCRTGRAQRRCWCWGGRTRQIDGIRAVMEAPLAPTLRGMDMT